MKSIFAALPVFCFLVTGCDTADQQEDGAMEAPAPTLESDQPDTATETPAAPDRDQAAPGADMGAQYAEAEILPTEGEDTGGLIKLTRSGDSVKIEGTVTGLEPGAHGFHIHAMGDCTAPDASSAGDHFEPADDPHGAPEDPPGEHHLGDFGNITAGENGEAEVNVTDDEITLSGPDSVIGKAFIVHAGQDDLESQPSGDSGARIGCGVIHALEVAESSTTI